MVNFKGQPIHLTLTPGQQHEITQASELLEHAKSGAFLGDIAYNSNDLARQIQGNLWHAVIYGSRVAAWLTKRSTAIRHI